MTIKKRKKREEEEESSDEKDQTEKTEKAQEEDEEKENPLKEENKEIKDKKEKKKESKTEIITDPDKDQTEEDKKDEEKGNSSEKEIEETENDQEKESQEETQGETDQDKKDQIDPIVKVDPYDEEEIRSPIEKKEEETTPEKNIREEILEEEKDQAEEKEEISQETEEVAEESLQAETEEEDLFGIDEREDLLQKLKAPQRLESLTYPYQLKFDSHQYPEIVEGDGDYMNWDIRVHAKDFINMMDGLDSESLGLSVYIPQGQGISNIKISIPDLGIENEDPNVKENNLERFDKKISNNDLKALLPDGDLHIKVRAKIDFPSDSYSIGLRLTPDNNYIQAIWDQAQEEAANGTIIGPFGFIIRYVQSVGDIEKFFNGFNLLDVRLPSNGSPIVLGDTRLSTPYADETRTMYATDVSDEDQEGEERRIDFTVSETLRLEDLIDSGKVKRNLGNDIYGRSFENASSINNAPDVTIFTPNVDGTYNEETFENMGKTAFQQKIGQMVDDGDLIPGTIIQYRWETIADDPEKESSIKVNFQNRLQEQTNTLKGGNQTATIRTIAEEPEEPKPEEKYGKVTLKKVDKDDNSPLSGAEFTLSGEGIIRRSYSKEDGSVTFDNVPQGAYEITETGAPQGYKPTSAVYKIKVLVDDIGNSQVIDNSEPTNTPASNSPNFPIGKLRASVGVNDGISIEKYELNESYTKDGTLYASAFETLSLNLELRVDKSVHEGDSFDIKLDEKIQPYGLIPTVGNDAKNTFNPPDIKFGTATIATGSYDKASNTITYTFTDYVDKNENVYMFINIGGMGPNRDIIKKSSDQTFTNIIAGEEKTHNFHIDYKYVREDESKELKIAHGSFEEYMNSMNFFPEYNKDAGEVRHITYLNVNDTQGPNKPTRLSFLPGEGNSNLDIENSTVNIYIVPNDQKWRMNESMSPDLSGLETLSKPIRKDNNGFYIDFTERDFNWSGIFGIGRYSNRGFIVVVDTPLINPDEDKDIEMKVNWDTLTNGSINYGEAYIHATDRIIFSGSSAGGSGDSIDDGIDIVVPNEKKELPEKLGKIEINKVNEEGKALQGAEFTLTGEGVNITKASQADGTISFEDLEPGIYTLEETKAPSGYDLIEGTWVIVVNNEGNTSLVSEPDTPTEVKARTFSNPLERLFKIQETEASEAKASVVNVDFYKFRGSSLALNLSIKDWAKEGDSFTIQLDEKLVPTLLMPLSEENSKDFVYSGPSIKDGDEFIAHDGVYDRDTNTITYTFTDYVERHKNVQISITLNNIGPNREVARTNGFYTVNNKIDGNSLGEKTLDVNYGVAKGPSGRPMLASKQYFTELNPEEKKVRYVALLDYQADKEARRNTYVQSSEITIGEYDYINEVVTEIPRGQGNINLGPTNTNLSFYKIPRNQWKQDSLTPDINNISSNYGFRPKNLSYSFLKNQHTAEFTNDELKDNVIMIVVDANYEGDPTDLKMGYYWNRVDDMGGLRTASAQAHIGFVDKSGQGSGEVISEPKDLELTITNQKSEIEKTGKFTITKTDEDKNPLENAEFTLTKIEDEDGNEIEEKIDTKSSDHNGELSFQGLEPGVYRLVESKAPDGYVTSEDEWIITVDKNGVTSYDHISKDKMGENSMMQLRSMALRQASDNGDKSIEILGNDQLENNSSEDATLKTSTQYGSDGKSFETEIKITAGQDMGETATPTDIVIIVPKHNLAARYGLGSYKEAVKTWLTPLKGLDAYRVSLVTYSGSNSSIESGPKKVDDSFLNSITSVESSGTTNSTGISSAFGKAVDILNSSQRNASANKIIVHASSVSPNETNLSAVLYGIQKSGKNLTVYNYALGSDGLKSSYDRALTRYGTVDNPVNNRIATTNDSNPPKTSEFKGHLVDLPTTTPRVYNGRLNIPLRSDFDYELVGASWQDLNGNISIPGGQSKTLKVIARPKGEATKDTRIPLFNGDISFTPRNGASPISLDSPLVRLNTMQEIVVSSDHDGENSGTISGKIRRRIKDEPKDEGFEEFINLNLGTEKESIGTFRKYDDNNNLYTYYLDTDDEGLILPEDTVIDGQNFNPDTGEIQINSKEVKGFSLTINWNGLTPVGTITAYLSNGDKVVFDKDKSIHEIEKPGAENIRVDSFEGSEDGYTYQLEGDSSPYVINVSRKDDPDNPMHPEAPNIDIINKKKQKGNFQIKKVDSQDENITLEGAVFRLKDSNGNWVGEKLSTGEDGIAKFENLESGFYEVWEIEAPEGYKLPEDQIVSSFTVKEDGEIVDILNDSAIITNEKSGMYFLLDKVSMKKDDQGERLETRIDKGILGLRLQAPDGKTFPESVKVDEEGTEPSERKYKITKVSDDRTSIELEIDLEDAYETIENIDSGSNKAIKIDVPGDWPSGEYTLTESKAPAGFVKTGEAYKLYIDMDQSTISHGETNLYSKELLEEGKLGILKIINNRPVYPSAGGRGILAFILIGVLVMLFSIYVYNKRRVVEP